MSKILITSGCSFSECVSPHIDTWPRHLARLLPEYEHTSYAMGSQGNGLISRGIIYGVTEALKTHKPEDILVGVMWSGYTRHDYRVRYASHLSFDDKNIDGWIENPTGFINEPGIDKNWVILNLGWQCKEAQLYRDVFFDYIGAMIYSLEHALRTQWFLQLHNVPYFFTDFTNDNMVATYEYENNYVEVMHLYNQLDKNYYLPVRSEHDWLCDNSKYVSSWPSVDRNNPYHPTTEMHKEFAHQVIMPWLKEKYAGFV